MNNETVLPDGSSFFVGSVEVPKNTSTHHYQNIPDDIKQGGIDYAQKHDTEVCVREFSFIDGAMWYAQLQQVKVDAPTAAGDKDTGKGIN